MEGGDQGDASYMQLRKACLAAGASEEQVMGLASKAESVALYRRLLASQAVQRNSSAPGEGPPVVHVPQRAPVRSPNLGTSKKYNPAPAAALAVAPAPAALPRESVVSFTPSVR